jgi:hypothetical protein
VASFAIDHPPYTRVIISTDFLNLITKEVCAFVMAG